MRAVFVSYGVSAAAVFGSVARREVVPSSDLDLFVCFHDGNPRDLVGLFEALSRLIGLHVDVIAHETVFAQAQAARVGRPILRDTVPL
nr:nucleotidyltransferase domain-containing protein [Cryobacterium sp. Y11]